MRPLSLLLLVLVGLITSCSHYRLGADGQLAFTTLYVAPVKNDTQAPQVVALFSAQLRAALLREGRVTLVNSAHEADATLEVALTRFARNATTARQDDAGLARKFDLTLGAVCSLRDNRTDRALFEQRAVETTRQIFSTPTPASRESDQLQAEYNVMPLLAQSLATRVAHAALDVW